MAAELLPNPRLKGIRFTRCNRPPRGKVFPVATNADCMDFTTKFSSAGSVSIPFPSPVTVTVIPFAVSSVQK